jgi:hypothetical protein
MIPRSSGSYGRARVGGFVLMLMALGAFLPEAWPSRADSAATLFTVNPFFLYPLVVQPMLHLLLLR